MSSKSLPKHTLLPIDTSTSARPSFDSHRFTTESTMMHTHAQTLLTAGTVDAAMATQLAQSWHRTGEVRMQYSKEYLQMHPDYTGENAHEMPTLNWAMKKHRERDLKAEEWLEEYLRGEEEEEGEMEGENHAVKGAGEEEEEWETATESASGSANAPISPPVQRAHNPYTSSPICLSNSSPRHSSPLQHSSPNAKPAFKHSSNSDSSQPTQKLQPKSKSSSMTSSDSSHPTPKRKYKSKSTSKSPSPSPLTPLPNHPTYAAHDYFALAALCRARKLPGAGRAGVLRNRLIQDDMNVAAGKERETKRGTGGRRRYVHGVPGEGSSGGEDKSSGGEEKQDEAVVAKKDVSEEPIEDLTGEKGGKRKRYDKGDGEDVEAKKVKLIE